jgi:hypothetical protein
MIIANIVWLAILVGACMIIGVWLESVTANPKVFFIFGCGYTIIATAGFALIEAGKRQ